MHAKLLEWLGPAGVYASLLPDYVPEEIELEDCLLKHVRRTGDDRLILPVQELDRATVGALANPLSAA